jgi:hypothetical protein
MMAMMRRLFRLSRRDSVLARTPILLIMLAANAASAQSCIAPETGDPPLRTRQQILLPRKVEPPVEAPVHRFWDRTNLLLFSGVGAMRAMDYASTRNMQRRGREEVLLPDDVVNNSAGFAALEAAGTAASVGISYWMHRTGHHRLERWVSIVHIGVTGFGVVRNYTLDTYHTATVH